MLSAFLEHRIKQLEANIAKDYNLLNRVEDALRTEESPVVQEKYKSQIQRLRESATEYQQEHDYLVSRTAGEKQIELQGISVQLHNMDVKLDSLITHHGEVCEELGDIREVLLNQYNASERNIIAAITGKLNEVQITIVQQILTALEVNSIPEEEMYQILVSVQQALTTLPQQTDIPDRQEVGRIIADPAVEWKHKVKLTIPLIPAILNYEVELGAGVAANLKNLWNRLVSTVKG